MTDDSVSTEGDNDAVGDFAVTTEDVSTAPPESLTGPIRRRRRLWTAIAIGAAVAVALTAAAFLVKLPYFVIQPGSVRPAEQRIEIQGTDSYETSGRVMFVTVYINQANPALMIRSWLDDSIQVRTREEMYPDGNEEEVRQQNVVLMDTSKVVAEKVALSYLGFDAEFTGDGALVAGLVDKSPSKGVLKPGDVVVKVDGEPVSMPDDIGAALSQRDPGDKVSIVVERPVDSATGSVSGGNKSRSRKRTLELALGADPDEPARPVLGIFVEPHSLSVESPIGVQVDSGSVTGPSAGLAWTLAIIDRLTPGSLTDERQIAVTGEIRADGSVGAVGGVPQKVAAVKRAGVKVFIYPEATPEDEKRQIKKLAGDELKVYAVSDIDEAVRVLVPEGLHGG